MKLKAIIIYNEIAYGFYGEDKLETFGFYTQKYNLYSFWTDKRSYGRNWKLEILSWNPLYPDIEIHKKILKGHHPNVQIISNISKKWHNEIKNELKEMVKIIYDSQIEIIKFHPKFK